MKIKAIITAVLILICIQLTLADTPQAQLPNINDLLDNPATLDLKSQHYLLESKKKAEKQKLSAISELAAGIYLLATPNSEIGIKKIENSLNNPYASNLFQEATNIDPHELKNYLNNSSSLMKLSQNQYSINACENCFGKGWLACKKCKGTGQLDSGPCTQCNGYGIIKCSQCNGQGITVDKKELPFGSNTFGKTEKLLKLLNTAEYLLAGGPDYFTSDIKKLAPEISTSQD